MISQKANSEVELERSINYGPWSGTITVFAIAFALRLGANFLVDSIPYFLDLLVKMLTS